MANLVAQHYTKFSWSYNNDAAAHGTAEISDFGPEFKWQHLGPHKVGVMVQGRTNVIPFVLVTEEYVDEGDVTLWRFVSDHERFPGCTLTIFND